MGGLKEHQFCESDEFFREYTGPLSNETHLYYLKSEADKAIADLEESHKKEVEQLIMEIVRLKDKQKTEVKELRHHKYKRCLAVARRCHNESLWWYSKGYGFEKYDKFWEKWEKRWLELANKYKYKEAK